MRVKGTKPPLVTQGDNQGYILVVRQNLGRGSTLVTELHRRAAGSTRRECMDEAEALERELNGGMTYEEAARHRIDLAREKRDGVSSAAIKQGAFFVAVFTVHQATQMTGLNFRKKRTAAKSSKASSAKSSRRLVA